MARPCFLRLRPALRSNPMVYRAAEETVHSWILRRDINVNTLSRFGRLWVRNLCRNMDAFLRCPGVAGLAGTFGDLPGLIVAGGPSLDALLPRLPELRQRMLVVAVNTPVSACRAYGVEPDFTVVVDPQYWASRYLDWTGTDNGVMVAEPSACPRAFRREAPFFLCSSLFPLGEILESAVGEKGKLGAGGSVATSAWDLARLLGARPLYVAGLDLGFPGMRTHCRGVFAEEMSLAASGRLAPVEGSSFRSIRDIGLFPSRSTAGGVTFTDRRMLLYKWWFENQMRMQPALSCFTLSADGIAVEGIPLAPLAQALALPGHTTRDRSAHDARQGDPSRPGSRAARSGAAALEHDARGKGNGRAAGALRPRISPDAASCARSSNGRAMRGNASTRSTMSIRASCRFLPGPSRDSWCSRSSTGSRGKETERPTGIPSWRAARRSTRESRNRQRGRRSSCAERGRRFCPKGSPEDGRSFLLRMYSSFQYQRYALDVQAYRFFSF